MTIKYGYMDTNCLTCGSAIEWVENLWRVKGSYTGDPTCWHSTTKTHTPILTSWIALPTPTPPAPAATSGLCTACGYGFDTASHELGCLPHHNTRAYECAARYPGEASFPDEWCGTCN